ncbi:MAG: DNA cytosine methyltransferase [Roseibium sp.]|uniref:DNA cytosine methyltransferase n=2 Tax=Roseibium sp. TaxID=1936156 RepID=UPI001B0B49CC|nr:DNA cytosine methyltransferase [Roseibium sp.]MBO6930832.1 DNA cytosine methyltransferase [Roseibium sp.]
MRFADIFCGVGGMSHGLIEAGYNLQAALDAWPEAMEVHKNNIFKRPGQPVSAERMRKFYRGFGTADISEIAKWSTELLEHDLDMIVGGPPCQDFSVAGSKIEGQRAALSPVFAMTICIVRPEWFIMENVPGALYSNAYLQTRKLLKNAGYGISEVVCKASHYGVPQMRKRAFVIGRLGEADWFLNSAIEGARSPQQTTIREALGDDAGVHPGNGHLDHVRAFFIRPFTGGRGVRSTDEVCPTLIRTSHEVPRPSYKPHKDDLALANEVRPLNFEELCQIQGFPVDWDWSGIEKLSGPSGKMQALVNAVPPPLAKEIGQVILDRHHGRSIPDVEKDFIAWLKSDKGLSGGTIQNKKSLLNRARTLIKGRVLTDLSQEISLLEASPEFGTLSPQVKSDLRSALRLHAEWRKPFEGLIDKGRQDLLEWCCSHEVTQKEANSMRRQLAKLQKSKLPNAADLMWQRHFGADYDIHELFEFPMETHEEETEKAFFARRQKSLASA